MGINKKIAILVADGMADHPIESIGGKTPLELARTPNLDYIARNGVMGLVKTVPDKMVPGSDIANLSIFGYNPIDFFTGRAPLEAINMGIELGPEDVAFRCNLVNISNDIMVDFCAGHIETEFTRIVIDELKKEIDYKGIEFFPGVSYRNIFVWRDYPYNDIPETTPPHDIQGDSIKTFLPKGDGAEMLLGLTKKSLEIIEKSDLIKSSKKKFRGDPTSGWFWGGGRKPLMESMNVRYGLNGYTISAVDLIHGIGRAIGLSPLYVEGVTGYIDTNYSGKADALLGAIKDVNFVLLHLESPDEAGHEGNLNHKIMAIEDFDAKIVGKVIKGLEEYNDFTLLVMPDHPTPVELKTHTDDPVPFCLYSNKDFSHYKNSKNVISGYSEVAASQTGILLEEGYRLLDIMVKGKFF